MNTKYLTVVATGALTASLFVPLFAFAQEISPAVAGAPTRIGTPHVRTALTASTTADTTRAARAKDKAGQEIDRRIEAMQALLTRVEAMNKVTDTLKNNLKTNIQVEIDGFNSLKVKIDGDTDLPTLKSDIKSITESYRIFALVLPQGRVSAAADRMATVINMMTATGAKLQARVTSATQSGSNTTALTSTLTDLAAKLTSASTHAQGSINLVAPLVPDNGDKAVMASNEAALKKAHDELKAGQADIVAARKDIEAVVKGLKSLKPSSSASSTTQASQ